MPEQINNYSPEYLDVVEKANYVSKVIDDITVTIFKYIDPQYKLIKLLGNNTHNKIE